jgi:DNA-binding response OmpR family regulator
MNHIIGYSELLLEETTDANLVEVEQSLSQIRLTGKRLVARLGEIFANRGVPPEIQLQPVADELCTVAESVTDITRLLRDKLPSDFHKDLSKIETAVRNFTDLVHQHTQLTDIQPLEERPSYLPRSVAHRSLITGKLLVVDDIPENREMLMHMLTRQGHTVVTAENGREAVNALHSQPFDMVLLDLMMPIMNGFEVLTHLKADETLNHIPVVIISALDEINSAAQSIEGGAEDYLTKPFDPVLLRARINACLERKRLRDAELLYLYHVKLLTHAALGVENETFEPDPLVVVADRQDPLGNLARVFIRMAHEVYNREAKLRERAKLTDLSVNLEQKARTVDQITSSDFFQQLKSRTRRLN